MTRSKKIDDAVARIFLAKDEEYTEKLDAIISALDIITNERQEAHKCRI